MLTAIWKFNLQIIYALKHTDRYRQLIDINCYHYSIENKGKEQFYWSFLK